MSFSKQDFLDAVEEGKVKYKSYKGDIYELDDVDDLWSEIHGESGETNYFVEGVGPIEGLDSGGGMDEGSNAYTVFKVGGTYFRKSGYYASHYGYDWDGDFEEVEPFQKTVIDYRTIR